ncbi:MAG: hypothetical protein CMM91_10335 [Rickettsiales bacterium]|nr:hypothetical protein [Rickettsiales bacterium]OUV52872.1 MAG: hypothetical protein CBC87_05820 [Rickettsiales bacterium TMED127]|tara:strand:+ start:13963 stop:14163 length:201 start_codon:yes stop_codon:yes gene_type:complete
MSLVVNDILEKITNNYFEGEKFKIVSLKNLDGRVHASIVNINDEFSEYTVALSVLEDKTRFKVVKK